MLGVVWVVWVVLGVVLGIMFGVVLGIVLGTVLMQYLHWVLVHCDTNSYTLLMEIRQPNGIYFQRHDHEVQSKMMCPKKISVRTIISSQVVGSGTNVFSTSNEIGNELIRFAILDHSQ